MDEVVVEEDEILDDNESDMDEDENDIGWIDVEEGEWWYLLLTHVSISRNFTKSGVTKCDLDKPQSVWPSRFWT